MWVSINSAASIFMLDKRNGHSCDLAATMAKRRKERKEDRHLSIPRTKQIVQTNEQSEKHLIKMTGNASSNATGLLGEENVKLSMSNVTFFTVCAQTSTVLLCSKV